jgi:hypothetical protein
MDWGTVSAVTEDVTVVGGIGWMIGRQFRWRQVAGLLRLPLALLGLGAGWIVSDLLHGSTTVTPLDAAVLSAELLLVVATGSAMGLLYRFRPPAAKVECRLSRGGLLLWAVFVAIRLASFLLARHLGAHLLETTGAVLVSFASSRLAAALVVQRRSSRRAGHRRAQTQAEATTALPDRGPRPPSDEALAGLTSCAPSKQRRPRA